MAKERRKKLRYVSDEEEGFRRKRHGRGYIYYDYQGNKVDKELMAERLDGLAIPPRWDDVWICQDVSGHLQVTGYDEKGRKQYIYHPDWVAYSKATKFNRLTDFAKELPAIREQVDKDLKQDDWSKEKVLALVLSILDESYIRIGNKEYLEENNTYGLTTLRRKHLSLNKKEATLRYKAKSGKEREVNIDNKELIKLIKECSELPGYELFRYQEGSKTQTIDSEDVNEYLRKLAGDEFSSKDFRTWGGTVVAVEVFEEALQEVKENPRKQLESTLIQIVAERLGNTPAVCRDYYIHPAILEAVEDGSLQKCINSSTVEQKNKYDLRKAEKLALRLLKKYIREKQPEELILTGEQK